MTDDLSSGGEIQDLMRRIKRLESAIPLQNASVTKGRLRFIGGLLLIDSGGTLQVIGTFDGNGDFTWSGPWVFSGNGDITGDVTISGDVDLTGEMRVTGRIIIEGADDATLEDGKLSFDTGGAVEADTANSGVMLSAAGGNKVYVGPDIVGMQFVGGPAILITPSGLTFSGLPTIDKGLTPDENPVGSLYVNTSGQAFRVIDP